MSVSRMKNLIILVLSICAVCLLAVAVPNRLSQTHEQRRMLAELKTLYESYGLRIELDAAQPDALQRRAFRERCADGRAGPAWPEGGAAGRRRPL